VNPRLVAKASTHGMPGLIVFEGIAEVRAPGARVAPVTAHVHFRTGTRRLAPTCASGCSPTRRPMEPETEALLMPPTGPTSGSGDRAGNLLWPRRRVRPLFGFNAGLQGYGRDSTWRTFAPRPNFAIGTCVPDSPCD